MRTTVQRRELFRRVVLAVDVLVGSESTKSFFFGLVLFSLPLIWKKIPSDSPYPITSLTAIELVGGLLIGILFVYFLNRIKIS